VQPSLEFLPHRKQEPSCLPGGEKVNSRQTEGVGQAEGK
jgi:hypothetical protein